ncbi:hypothetical protein B0T13DRAFT_310844 [Neurospora crassa]|nr:hypothetical protein B0T13DRAFT_310844 [Neurospora crassa]
MNDPDRKSKVDQLPSHSNACQSPQKQLPKRVTMTPTPSEHLKASACAIVISTSFPLVGIRSESFWYLTDSDVHLSISRFRCREHTKSGDMQRERINIQTTTVVDDLLPSSLEIDEHSTPLFLLSPSGWPPIHPFRSHFPSFPKSIVRRHTRGVDVLEGPETNHPEHTACLFCSGPKQSVVVMDFEISLNLWELTHTGISEPSAFQTLFANIRAYTPTPRSKNPSSSWSSSALPAGRAFSPKRWTAPSLLCM